MTTAPLAGECNLGTVVHAFLTERDFDHPEMPPLFNTARTCHQYVPFGTVFLSVARVLRVAKSSYPDPRTGDAKAGSAAIWNS